MNPGDRVSKYRIVGPLATDVWLAERTEDFAQQVCVAVISQPQLTSGREGIPERMRKLAALHHPAIARVLDSGETADKRPYFLFEYLPAEAAIAWVPAQDWNVDRRIALALTFFDALSLAHRNLLAHGNLTAEGFLVTPAGQPLLTAFPCVVSLSDPVSADLSAAAAFLAALLNSGTTARLPRDLKAIVDKATAPAQAMQRVAGQAQRSYESVDALAADLRRFLEHRPVSARKPSRLYRAALFVQRRPELFYPGIMLSAAILAATIYSVKMDAEAQRSRIQAQARLLQLQKLTYSLESDLYQPVSQLPNSTQARETLIQWTSDSLDNLSAQAGSDRELRARIAQSYTRLAEVERANGDERAARSSEEKALAAAAMAQGK